MRLASERWKIGRDTIDVADGKLIAHDAPSGQVRTVGFGELTHGQKLMEVIGDSIAPTPPAHWSAAGRSIPKVDGRAFVTGRHRYASDIQRDGMLHGKVLRPPAFGAGSSRPTRRRPRPFPG